MGARAGIAATPACMAASVAIAAPIASVMRVLPLASMWTYWREKGGRVGIDHLGEGAADVGERFTGRARSAMKDCGAGPAVDFGPCYISLAGL